ncbi:magnesium transporter CorA family protein [Patescibacteria group bacterium]
MIKTHTHKKITWIDLESPTHEEVRSLMQEYKLNPFIANELIAPTFKSSVEAFKDSIYLILHFPAFKHSHSGAFKQEVDFVIGKDFIITTHYDTIDQLHKFSKIYEVDSILEKSDIGDSADLLFVYMLQKLYKSLTHELEFIQDSIMKIEEKIFLGEEKKMVREISKIGRDLLNFNQAVESHQEILKTLDKAGHEFFGDEFKKNLKVVINDYYRINKTLRNNRDLTRELRETNDSLLTTKQNEIMKFFTIIAFITFPLSLLASIFGMNTVIMPIVGLKGDFWIIISVMVIATIFMILYSRHKKWL